MGKLGYPFGVPKHIEHRLIDSTFSPNGASIYSSLYRYGCLLSFWSGLFCGLLSTPDFPERTLFKGFDLACSACLGTVETEGLSLTLKNSALLHITNEIIH